MMKLPIYQVDAFTDQVFGGNPAAVIPLTSWLADDVLQAIADENNLSETAFLLPSNTDSSVDYELRWFTPQAEVDLCGHATLAAAHVVFTQLAFEAKNVRFSTRSGMLEVKQTEVGYAMEFPATMPTPVPMTTALLRGLGCSPVAVLKGFDYIAVLANEQAVRDLEPNFSALAELDGRGVVVTAAGENCDFVSRCFFPKLRVNEDPVTGSAHCQLAPFWLHKEGLDKEALTDAASKVLTAQQLSARGGSLQCQVVGDRVVLFGQAIDYMKGEITLTL